MTVQIEIMDLGRGEVRETIEIKEDVEYGREEEIKRGEFAEEKRD
jgi:hypothetical protein